MRNGDLDAEAIGACVERVLASESFSRSPQARRFLRYVVERGLNDDTEGLKAYTIGIQALGATNERSSPETTARMQAGRVRRLLRKFYEGEGRDDALELLLPTGGYAPRFIPRRPTALSPPPQTVSGYELPTLYVGEFENRSIAENDSIFCRGLAEEVTELLVETDGLRVSDAVPPGDADPSDLILTASVTRSGKNVRVVSRLRSLDGQQMHWSNHADAELSEEALLEVQDILAHCIASQVGDPVHGAFMRVSSRSDSSSLGYRGVQRAFRFFSAPTPARLDEAQVALEDSLRIAPDEALIHALYATIVALKYMGAPTTRGGDLLSAETHAQSALEIDPECAWAHLAKAFVYYHHREQGPAKRELGLALECERASVTIVALAGNLHCLLGNWAEGVRLIRRARELQPHISGYLGLGLCLYYFFDQADLQQAHQVAQDFDLKENLWGAILEICCLGLLGRRTEARRAVARVVRTSPALPKKLSKHIHEALLLPELAKSLINASEEAGLITRHNPSPETARLSLGTKRTSLPTEIRVGILHSLSGPMAISEAHLVNAAMLAIEEINSAGGVLGRPVRGIIEDGCSDPQIFEKKARKLLEVDGATGIFGCWMSSSRKALIPVVESSNSLLWYPVQYEGLEGSRNIIYTGSCLNQQVEPAVRWAFRNNRTRCFLVGSDYVYPRTVNRLIYGLVEAAGGQIVGEHYEKLGGGHFASIAEQIAESRPDIVYNTLNGADNIAFFRALRLAGVGPLDSPVMSFSLSELELLLCGDLAEGHWACSSYFQSMSSPENKEIVQRFHRRYGENTVLSDPSVTAYAQLHLWKEVAESAGSLETAEILYHLPKCRLHLGGEILKMQANNHAERRAIIGQVGINRQFKVKWRSNRQIAPQPWLGIEDADLQTRPLVLQALRALPEIAERSSPPNSRVARS